MIKLPGTFWTRMLIRHGAEATQRKIAEAIWLHALIHRADGDHYLDAAPCLIKNVEEIVETIRDELERFTTFSHEYQTDPHRAIANATAVNRKRREGT